MNEPNIDMSAVDLEDPEFDKPAQRYRCREGAKVFGVCGMERGHSNQKKTPKLDIELYCVKDLVDPDPAENPPSDEGLTVRMTCWMTPKALGSNLIRVFRALNYSPGLDPETGERRKMNLNDDEQILAAISDGYFIADVVHNEGINKKGEPTTYANVEAISCRPYQGEVDPEWDHLLNAASEEYQRRKDKYQSYNAQPQSSSTDVPDYTVDENFGF